MQAYFHPNPQRETQADGRPASRAGHGARANRNGRKRKSKHRERRALRRATPRKARVRPAEPLRMRRGMDWHPPAACGSCSIATTFRELVFRVNAAAKEVEERSGT